MIAPAAPEVTMAASAPDSSAILAPAARCKSISGTKYRDASAIASRASGTRTELVSGVSVPAALISGSTPSRRKMSPY